MHSKIFGLLGAVGIHAAVQAGSLEAVRSFQVYAISDIRALEGDFEGAVGAGGNVSLTRFSLAAKSTGPLALSSGGRFTLDQGTVDRGSVEASSMKLQNSSVRGDLLSVKDFEATEGNSGGKLEHGGAVQLTRFVIAKGARKTTHLALASPHATYAQALYAATLEYAALAPTARAESQGASLVFNAKASQNVFNVNKEILQKARLIRVKGSPDSIVVINVLGEGELNLDSKDVELQGGLASENVLWNFPRLSSLTIQHSGHSSASDRPGVQGTILAPYAQTSLRESLIVGHLFVGLLDSWQGQVNEAPFFGLGSSSQSQSQSKP